MKENFVISDLKQIKYRNFNSSWFPIKQKLSTLQSALYPKSAKITGLSIL